MKLSDQQTKALFKLVEGIRKQEKTIQTLGGFAGTGKTTLIEKLTKFFPDYGVCAYTGKAANILRRKGINASTIHSLIYKPFFDNGIIYFDLAHPAPCEGFIVDEASMVPEELFADIKCFDKPMIFVGDHGQLEPIGTDFNLMKKPDFCLEEIHRNAGDIAKYAEHIRKGFAPRGYTSNEDKVTLIGTETLDDYMWADQVIVAYNKTRVKINKTIRGEKGFKGKINVGERVMCLKNNKERGLFNGMQGTVLDLYTGKYKRKMMDFESGGEIIKEVWYDPQIFGQEKPDLKHSGKNKPNPFDYAYAITCHKAQGDEWGKVLVIEQKCKNWNHKRWAYTAASRAKEHLKWKLSR